MAVAVRLSRKLYEETLGDEAAEARVTWMESVERNRAELREAGDLAFARIDARFGQMEARFGEMEAGLEARLAHEVGRLEAKIEERFADLLKWSFTFWIGSTLTLVAIALAVLRT